MVGNESSTDIDIYGCVLDDAGSETVLRENSKDYVQFCSYLITILFFPIKLLTLFDPYLRIRFKM